MSPSPLSRRPPEASASIAVGISAPQRAGQKVGLLSQEAFQVFLSVSTVQFLRCQWVALLSLRFLSWACSEHVLPASPLPPPSRQSGPYASFPEQCGACRVPRVLSPACPSSPRRLHHHVLLRIPVGVSPAQTCVSTGAQTACPSECVLSFPGACSLCGLPFMVALGSRFLSIHVLFCQL